MPAVSLDLADLDPFATIDVVKAQAMIDDAMALARFYAPCILADDFAFADTAKAIIRRAILRWNDTGSGAMQSQTAGPFGVTIDTRQPQSGAFWPSEIDQLQGLCGTGSGTSYTLSLAGPDAVPSYPWVTVGWT